MAENIQQLLRERLEDDTTALVGSGLPSGPSSSALMLAPFAVRAFSQSVVSPPVSSGFVSSCDTLSQSAAESMDAKPCFRSSSAAKPVVGQGTEW